MPLHREADTVKKTQRCKRMESQPPRGELDIAIGRLLREVREGLRHGFFDFAITCELVNGRKRRLTIKTGKSHQFIISEDDLTE